MMTPQEETLQQEILSAAHGDYGKKLNSYAYFKIHNHEMGEDMVQDTFLKTWKFLVKGGKIETMKAFLYHILNNLIVDEYRKQKHQTSSLDDLLEKGFEPSDSENTNIFSSMSAKALLLLIPRLPEKYQKVMHMRFVRDLSLEEISLISGQSKNTIAVQVHRGTAKLKLLFDPA